VFRGVHVVRTPTPHVKETTASELLKDASFFFQPAFILKTVCITLSWRSRSRCLTGGKRVGPSLPLD